MKTKNINNFIVYVHIRPDTNEPFYVGEGRPQRKFNKNGRNQYWWNVVNKNNGNFLIQTIYENLTKEQSLLKEKEISIELINKGFKLTNLAECGTYGGMVGKKHTIDSINKMKHPKHTIESKEKIRQSRLGKKDNINTFIKKSQASTGRVFSDESKIKKSQKLKGRKITWNLKGIKKDLSKKHKPINQYDLEGNFMKEWPSIKAAAEYIDINKKVSIGGQIVKCCKNKQTKAYGFKWQYKNNK